MSKTTGIYKNIDAQLLKKEAGDYAGCQRFFPLVATDLNHLWLPKLATITQNVLQESRMIYKMMENKKDRCCRQPPIIILKIVIFFAITSILSGTSLDSKKHKAMT